MIWKILRWVGLPVRAVAGIAFLGLAIIMAPGDAEEIWQGLREFILGE